MWINLYGRDSCEIKVGNEITTGRDGELYPKRRKAQDASLVLSPLYDPHTHTENLS